MNEIPKPKPFQIPGMPDLSLKSSIGEISQKIGRKLSLEQDCVVHKFAEKYPDVPIDDIVICHGHVVDPDHSQHYRIWVERMTAEEKERRDYQRKYGHPHAAEIALVLIKVLLWTQPWGRVSEGLPGWLTDRARTAVEMVSREAIEKAREHHDGGADPRSYNPVDEWFTLYPPK